MTATFLLPFSLGACAAVGGNPFTDAFGIVAMVAMTPLITIQILGVVFTLKERAKSKKETVVPQPFLMLNETEVEFDLEDLEEEMQHTNEPGDYEFGGGETDFLSALPQRKPDTETQQKEADTNE